MKIEAEVSIGERENEKGIPVPVTTVTCTRCDHQCWAWGKNHESKVAALAQLREECPEGEDNFYEG